MSPAPVTVGIAAGGTGGHVFPALAVAKALDAMGHRVVWFGTLGGLEARVVPAAGFEVEWIDIGGLRGKGLRTLLQAPFKLLKALWQALAALRRRQPDAVLGLGGFVSGPVGLATWLTRRPLLVHEQNAHAGLTNRVLARLATVVMEAFPGTFAAGRKAQAVGNPVRAEFLDVAPPAQRMFQADRPRLLVVGGSLGAKALNTLVPHAQARLPASGRPSVWHQGGRPLAVAQAAYAGVELDLRLDAFVDDMAGAYAWADLVVCRAGALTIAELSAAGCAAVLVPFPFAVDDHQTANGRHLVEAGAARMIQERELTADSLANLLQTLLGDRDQLRAMAEQARLQAMPDSCDTIVRQCLQAAGALS